MAPPPAFLNTICRMRLSVLSGTLAGVLAVALLSRVGAQGPDVRADYARANGLRDRIQNKVYDVAEPPTWIAGSARFWYRKSVPGGNQFVLVDPATSSKTAAFDHGRLAAALSSAA